MGRRAHSVVVEQTPAPLQVPIVSVPAVSEKVAQQVPTQPAPVSPAGLVNPPPEELSEREKLVSAAQKLLPLFDKINRKKYFCAKDFERIVIVCGGYRKRIFQRLLVGLLQRSLAGHDDEEVRRARMLLALHEAEQLEENLEAGA